MQSILFASVLVVIIFLLFNFLRKLHWDAIQYNLFELADQIGGSVMRRGILARPIFHGKYRDMDITINFSTDKSEGKRKNYIDISIGKKLNLAFTISSLDWIGESSAGSLEEFIPIQAETVIPYGIRQHKGRNLLERQNKIKVLKILKELDPFRFLHVSTNGMLFEKEGQNLGISTRHPNLIKDIETLYNLIQIVDKQ